MRAPSTYAATRQETDGAVRRIGAKQERDDLAARIMMQAYDWQGAMESCQRLLSRDPDHLGALETLAQAQWFGGQFDAVIGTTSKLLKLNPSEPGYRYTRGMAFLSNGELWRAYEDFQTAIAQSNNAEFKAQVASSIDTVERWLAEMPARKNRFGKPLLSPLGKFN